MAKGPEERMLLRNHCHINQDPAVFPSLSLALSPRFSPLGRCTVGQDIINSTADIYNVILSFLVN